MSALDTENLSVSAGLSDIPGVGDFDVPTGTGSLLDIQGTAFSFINSEVQRLMGLRNSIEGSQATSQKVKNDNVKDFAERIRVELASRGISAADKELIRAVQELIKGIFTVSPGTLGEPNSEAIYEQLLEQIGCTFLINVEAPVYITFLALQDIKSYAYLEQQVLKLLFELSLYLMLRREPTAAEIRRWSEKGYSYKTEFSDEYAYDIERMFNSVQSLGDSTIRRKSNVVAFNDYMDSAERLFVKYINEVTSDLNYVVRAVQETYQVLALLHEELMFRVDYYDKIISDYEKFDLSGKISKNILDNISLSTEDLRKYVTGISDATAKTLRQSFMQLAAGREVTRALFQANDPSGTKMLSGFGVMQGNILDCDRRIGKIEIGDYVSVSDPEIDNRNGRTINYRTVTATGTKTIQVSSKFSNSGGIRYWIWRGGSPNFGKYKLVSNAMLEVGLQPTLELERFGEDTFARLCGLYIQAQYARAIGSTWNGPDVDDLTDSFFEAMNELEVRLQAVIDMSNSFFMRKESRVHNILKLSDELGFDKIKVAMLKGRIVSALSLPINRANSAFSLLEGLSAVINGDFNV